MLQFSQAINSGVKIMDLPDAPKKQEAQMDDTSATLNFQDNQNQMEKKEKEMPK